MPEVPTPVRLERSLLDSGLTVVAQRAPAAAESFAATYIGPGGWGYDPAGRGGLAQVTSLLASSAAGRHDRVALARLLDSLGGKLRSGCDAESVELGVWGPAAAAEPLLDVLADVVLRPRFDASDLERVLRQLKERQLAEESQPAQRAEREMLRSIFPAGHPYRESGLGDARSARRIDRAGLRRFHRDHFTGAQGFLVVTGPWPMARVERLVRYRFREWAAGSAPPEPTLPAPARPPKGPVRIAMPGRAQVEVRFAGASIPRRDPRFPAAFLANEVLGGRGLLSRLWEKLRASSGLAYHSSSDLEAMRWGGYWEAQAGTGPERVERVARLMRAELRRIAADPVGTDELQRIRESAIGELPLGLETTAGAHRLAVEIAYEGLPDDFLERWPDELRAVTPRSLQEAAGSAMDLGSAVELWVGPLPRSGGKAR